jgi:hypothetical protein
LIFDAVVYKFLVGLQDIVQQLRHVYGAGVDCSPLSAASANV